jgi:hypothetical protein
MEIFAPGFIAVITFNTATKSVGLKLLLNRKLYIVFKRWEEIFYGLC